MEPRNNSSSSSCLLSSDEILTETLSQFPPLIPGLPNDLSLFILAFLPFSSHPRLKPTSRSWNLLLPSFRSHLLFLRQKWRKSVDHLLVFPSDPSLLPGALLDPNSFHWTSIPPMPCHPQNFGLSNFAAVQAGSSSVFVIGGAVFDARAFPISRPVPSPAVFEFNLAEFRWRIRCPMRSPRAGFACAVDRENSGVFVAGGGSRHKEFGAGGSIIGGVERYDLGKDEWVEVEGGLPSVRAGCVGFFVWEDEFWVMGGYGGSRTLSRVFPVDEYYRDGVVMEVKSGKWREIGEMWDEGERWRLGSVVAVENEDYGRRPEVFMLEKTVISRFDFGSNRWRQETVVPRKNQIDYSSSGFCALNGELYVMSSSLQFPVSFVKSPLMIQIYNPRTGFWRSTQIKTPFQNIDFRLAVICSVRI